MAIAGDTILVGAIHDGAGLFSFGSAYVFVRSGTGWTEQQKVVASDGKANTEFGASVALDGDLAVVRATETGGAGGPGAAYVFVRSGSTWTERTKLLASDGVTFDIFGISVAVANETLAVGASNHDHGAEATGSVYVFGLSFGEPYCTAGTSASGCQALLSATGTASATASSGFTLTASTVEGQKDGLFFFGTNGQQANPWGNGTSYQCVIPPVVRTPTMTGIGTIGLCDGSFALDLNALWCPTCPKPAKNPGMGATVQAQLWYRDSLSTSNQTTSLLDAVEFGVGL